MIQVAAGIEKVQEKKLRAACGHVEEQLPQFQPMTGNLLKKQVFPKEVV